MSLTGARIYSNDSNDHLHQGLVIVLFFYQLEYDSVLANTQSPGIR